MKNRRNDPLPWAMGTAACLFYLSTHSTFYNFDGVACAIAVELGDYAHLVHGNHLAYGVLGRLFFRLWQLLGYGGPAIIPLQVLDSLLGGAGAGVFCAWLLKLETPRSAAMLASAGLCLSQAYWLWSLEAQVYLLGTFCLLLAAHELAKKSPGPFATAVWHALAVLGHVGHAMFFPVGLWWLWKRLRSREALLAYALVLAAAVLAAYAGAALFFVRPQSFEDWRVWLLGSAALTLNKSFVWFGGYSGMNLVAWTAMNFRLFADPKQAAAAAKLSAWALGGLALAAAGLGMLRLKRSNRGWLAAAAAAWLASYALLFASWQPDIAVYRISDLVPLWLLIAWGVSGLPARAQAPLLAAYVACLGIFNWRTNILPKTRPENNRAYQEALWIASATPPDSWIAVDGLGEVYVPYFAHRRTINLQYYHGRERLIGERLDAVGASGGEIFVDLEALDGPRRKALEDYGLEVFARRGGVTLYRVGRKAG